MGADELTEPHHRPGAGHHRMRRARCAPAAVAAAALLGLAAGCGTSPGGETERDAGAEASSRATARGEAETKQENGAGAQAGKEKAEREGATKGKGAGRKEGKPASGSRARSGFSLFATGDLLVHDSIIRQARADAGGSGHDFRRMIHAARPMARKADVAICHMETVYGPGRGPFSGYPLFKTPPQLARSVKDLGYDSCSTASNHTLDAGSDGVTRTLDAMDAAGLRHAGSARNHAEATEPAMMRAGDAKVAQLAYTYGTNGISLPQDKPYLVRLIEPERIIADARAARRAGADVVLASLHWGTEWQQEPDSLQRSVARKLTASRSHGRRDIDLILGTHAHVPQAYEKVNGTWVVYGMGDQIAGKMNDPRGTMGSAARFRFAPPKGGGKGEWAVKKAEFTPFLMRTTPRHSLVNLADKASRNAGDPEQDKAYETIRGAVLSRGAAKDGLRMTP